MTDVLIIIKQAITFLFDNIIGIANAIIAFFLYRATIKIFKKSTSPELVFSLDVVNDSVAVGKLENIVNSIAFDIKVSFDPDIVISGQNISEAFFDLK